MTVFLDPITWHYEQDRLFERHPNGDYHAHFRHAKERLEGQGIPVHTGDFLMRGEFVSGPSIYIAIGTLKRYRAVADRGLACLSALFHTEAPIVHPSTYRGTPEAAQHFKRIFSFTTPRALERFGCGEVAFRDFRIPYFRDGVFESLWDRRDRKFLTMISQNKLPNLDWNELYTERLRILEYFDREATIDLYGIGWDRMPFRVGERRLHPQLVRLHRMVWEGLPFTRNHPHDALIKKVWRGEVASKHETLSGYTFAFCYENMELKGWINEKIFDAFVSGTIPIYRGGTDVADYIPEDCFIDPRRFSGYAELLAYLRSLGPDEIRRYRENARDYMASGQYYPFSKEAFGDIVVATVEEDLEGVR